MSIDLYFHQNYPYSFPARAIIDKRSIDNYIEENTLPKCREMFENINPRTLERDFADLEIAQRYGLVRMIQKFGSEATEGMKFITDSERKKVDYLFNSCQTPKFSEVLRILILKTLEKRVSFEFNNQQALPDLPRLLLIGSYFKDNIRGGLFPAPQLGLYRIASFLHSVGITTDVIDLKLDSEEDLYSLLIKNHYPLIGFNVLYPPFDVIKLISKIKENSPESILIAGGQGASFSDEFLLTHTPLDLIASSYGEFTLMDMLVDLDITQGPDQFKKIKGLRIKTKEKKIYKTGKLQSISEDDLRTISLTLDFSLIPYYRYWGYIRKLYSDKHLELMQASDTSRTIRIFTETHCAMKCDFCSSTNFLDNAIEGIQKVRYLAADDIVNMIRRAKLAYPDVQAIYFNDDDFLSNKSRIIALCQQLIKDNEINQLRYICMTRVDNVDENLLKLMKKAGFTTISYGIESFSGDILEKMNKKLRLRGKKDMAEVALETVQKTLSVGIVPRINFILFYPTVTLNDIITTVEVSLKLILKGAPPTYYTYVETFPGAQIMSKSFDNYYQYEELKINGQTYKMPVRILPVDPEIRKLINDTLENHTKTVDFFKKKYSIEAEGLLPTSMDTLILFYGLYKIAKLENTHLSLAIDSLMKKFISKSENSQNTRIFQ